MEYKLSDIRPPDGWKSYLVTFKNNDIHPLEKVPMKDRAVRIFAPSDEAAKIVVGHRFGKSFYQLHDEKQILWHRPIFYPKGIFETLHFKHVKEKYKLN